MPDPMTAFRFLFLFLVCLIPLTSNAGSIFKLLHNGTDEAVALRLEVPMDSLLNKTRVEHQGQLSFTDIHGKSQDWEVEVGLRGRFRRQNCDNAPLKLNFSKRALKNAGLAKFDKYKLVVSCFDSEESDHLVYREYLAYRAYNLISDQSFRVQLLTITYVDSDGKHADRVAPGFIIEETDELADRMGTKEFEGVYGAPASSYNARAEVTHALVQYLLGNGDYSTAIGHNMKVYGSPDIGLIPVGYDFDFSGWVGAPYARISSGVGQRSIYERVYLGYAQDDAIMHDVADHILTKKTAVVDLITDFSLLPDKPRRTLRRFAAGFFRDLASMNDRGGWSLYEQLREANHSAYPIGAEEENFQSKK